MLSVLQWDTIKYRCGEERPAAMLSNRVHPVSYLSGPADSSRAPTHTPAETDRAEEKTTTSTQPANNTDDRRRTSSLVGLLGFSTYVVSGLESDRLLKRKHGSGNLFRNRHSCIIFVLVKVI